jgi:hypothetical protein
VVIIGIFAILGSSLFAYDQYQTYKDRKLGAELIKKISVNSSCDKIVNAGEKFDLKFSLKNDNNQKVHVEKVGVGVSLLGTGEKKFFKLLNTNPSSSKLEGAQSQTAEFLFESDIVVRTTGKKNIVLKMGALGRNSAKTSPHTIVVYKGEVVFYFDHEMSLATSCQVQVRYS